MVLFFVSVLLGSYTVTIPDFLRILGGERIPGSSFIVLESKLPRAVTAVLIGAAFGVSGHLFQTMLRNPLASPDIIGISYGASAAAVTAMVAFGATGGAVSLAALLGAAAIALALHLLTRSGGASGARLVLIGIGFAAVLQAVVNFLLTRTDVRTAAESLVWLTGSLNSATWERAGIVALALVVLLPAAALLGRRLRVLELGDDFAAGLGLPVERTRAGLLFTGVALAAAATAAAGPVAFVAFLAGPISRRLIGGRASLAAAGLTGAVILLAADFAGHNLIPGTVLPVGVITGALGAPFLLWLLVSSNRVGRGG
ncbi:FecCD family ABC transporter permease [Arthrobacter caoxuetaonis]|uniref:Iron chelate uptake ABC transporter family permease subunit n=1 Tax=Arthrobacter caoxuetaonis TaxID=2886935 RepID=A0A9X1MB13_9MICC|nr:iron chelate uptake ABC transporter family permease subunit [Arthrobacter caoxuetaonis]MCC3296236.1 iron chelate uptake ABC transporter family permease subunit [Arthrobacter caoxuetaonis]USQ58930.1 iron chelate uptake ABC transporter family permease subunit [Arthrobacter caoxuetaonis]